MRVGDEVCIGISRYDPISETYIDFDTVDDVVMKVYTDQRHAKTYSMRGNHNYMDRKTANVLCAFVDTKCMRSGTLFCEFYVIQNGKKGETYTKEIGYLKEMKKYVRIIQF